MDACSHTRHAERSLAFSNNVHHYQRHTKPRAPNFNAQIWTIFSKRSKYMHTHILMPVHLSGDAHHALTQKKGLKHHHHRRRRCCRRHLAVISLWVPGTPLSGMFCFVYRECVHIFTCCDICAIHTVYVLTTVSLLLNVAIKATPSHNEMRSGVCKNSEVRQYAMGEQARTRDPVKPIARRIQFNIHTLNMYIHIQ